MNHKKRYLVQSNFFTKSLFNLEKDIHKNIVYLIQTKIDYFGAPRDIITINYDDYLKARGISNKDTYSFSKFQDNVMELKNIGGAFRNKINNSFVSFNIIDNVQINPEDAQSLNIQLAKFGKIFFFKDCLEEYIREVSPLGQIRRYSGHTKIEDSVINLKGFRRKKFFELVSQFKSTGYFKIALLELKMVLGFVQIIDKNTKEPIEEIEKQLSFIFSPDETNYTIIDKGSRYSIFERDFLVPAIKAINSDKNKDINNLKIRNKLKTGRKITHLEFTFNSLKKEYTEEEQIALNTFVKLGLDETQVQFLLKRIGYMEMYGRYNKYIKKDVDYDKNQVYYNRLSDDQKQKIENMSGFLYKVVFPELRNDE